MADQFLPIACDWRWLSKRGIRTVLDVGANTGQFALAIHKLLPNAMVYAFEPLRDCYEALVNNMKGVANFRAFPIALGDKDCEERIHRNEFSPSSSLLRMAVLHKMAFPYTTAESDETVTIRRLDGLVQDLNIRDGVLVKLDVQGYEDKVIAGGYNTVAQASVLIVETSFRFLYEGQPLFDAIFDQVRQMGFTYHGNLLQLRDPRDDSILQADSIFLKGDPSISSEEHEIWHWEATGRPTPPPNAVKVRTIKEYAERAGLRTFVESGTFLGDTLEACKDTFVKLFSIELDARLHDRARKKFSGLDRVCIIQGDSGAVLGQLLAEVTEPCLFWLDGHYSGVHFGSLTARGSRDTPIIEELEHILRHPVRDHVVLIDDARLFNGCNDYPTVAELRDLIASRRPDWSMEIKDDIIRVHSPRQVEGCCPLPWIRPIESAIYSRHLGQVEGTECWSRLYEGGSVMYKQCTGDLALRESDVLSRLKSNYFPKVRTAKSENGYSVVILEKVCGLPVARARLEVASSGNRLQRFALDCLAMLKQLRRNGIAHRRIGPDTVQVRDGRPVLTDFEWAINLAESNGMELGGAASEGDIRAIGEILEGINRHEFPLIELVLALMTEPECCLRVCDLDKLGRFLKAASDCGGRDAGFELWWGKGFERDQKAHLDPEACRLVIRELLQEISKRNQKLRPDIEREWSDKVHLALGEITEAVPAGRSFILIDEELLGVDEEVAGRRRFPFLEKGGQYWGKPPNDETAIQEIERLRGAGAGFAVFAWPAFWWLDYYPGLHDYLRSCFPCVLKNERLIVFDLRSKAPLGLPKYG